jgi:hypothetical protein
VIGFNRHYTTKISNKAVDASCIRRNSEQIQFLRS